MSEVSLQSTLQFLYENNYFKAFLALERQSNERFRQYGKEIDYFYGLITDGKFKEAESFVLPIRPRSDSTYRLLLFHLRKHRFLEVLESSKETTSESMIPVLKEVQDIASAEEFSSLCKCLKLSSISEHPDYANWDKWRGRVMCFYDCLHILKDFLAIDNLEPLPSKAPAVSQSTIMPKEKPIETRASIQHEQFAKNQSIMNEFHPKKLKEVAWITDNQPIRTCCFSPKGEYFALGTNSKSVKICAMNSAVPLENKEQDIYVILDMLNVHYGSVYCIDWSPDGRLIATGSNDKTIKLITCPDLLSIQEHNYDTIVYADGQVLQSSGRSPQIEEFLLKGHEGTVRSVCFHPLDSSIMASGGIADPELKLWDVETCQCVLELPGHSGAIHSIAASGDAHSFVSVGTDKTVKLWDMRTKSAALIFNTEHSMNSVSLNFEAQQVSAMTHISSKKMVAAGLINGGVNVWDLQAGKLDFDERLHTAECRSVSFSSNGLWMMSASFDCSLGFVGIKDQQVYKMEPHMDRIVSAKWHPILPLVLSTSADKTARILSINNS